MNNSGSQDLEQAKQLPQGQKVHSDNLQQMPQQQLQQQSNGGGNQHNDFNFRSYSSYLRNGNNNNQNNGPQTAAQLLKELKNPFYDILFALEKFKTSLIEMKFYSTLVIIVLFFIGLGTLFSSILQFLCIPLFLTTVEYFYLAKMSNIGLKAVHKKDFTNVEEILTLIRRSNICQLIASILLIIIFGIGLGELQNGTYDDEFQEWVDENQNGYRSTVSGYRHYYEGALGLIMFFSIMYNCLFFLIKRKSFTEKFMYYHKRFVLDIQNNQNENNQNQNQRNNNNGNQNKNNNNNQQDQPQQEINNVFIEEEE